jgi:DNA-binding transcriptional regulator YiaG
MPKESRRVIITPEEIRKYLKEHNISQVRAAELCTVSDRTFRRWIAGKTPMPQGAWELLKIKVERIESEE